MKKIIALSLALAAGTYSSSAMAEAYSGPYVGAEIGREGYEVKAKNMAIGSLTVSADGISGNGVVGGIFAGYDFALSKSIFAGVEATVNLSSAKISASATDGVSTISAAVKARESFGGSARLGAMLNDSTGIYARLGWIRTKFEVEAMGTVLGHNHREAFQYGGGLETRVTNHATLRVEYTRLSYGSAGLNALTGLNGIHVDNDQFRLGASYRF